MHSIRKKSSLRIIIVIYLRIDLKDFNHLPDHYSQTEGYWNCNRLGVVSFFRTVFFFISFLSFFWQFSVLCLKNNKYALLTDSGSEKDKNPQGIFQGKGGANIPRGMEYPQEDGGSKGSPPEIQLQFSSVILQNYLENQVNNSI